MKSDTPLDYAVFQLSPKRSKCELFICTHGNTEKLASGLLKPFATHLKVAEEQAALSVPSIKLEVQRCENAETWFTKGTFERFVRFVSTPEVLEVVNTLDAEVSQLEAARRIYSEEGGVPLAGEGGTKTAAAADATKKELLKAIDLRLVAARQDLAAAHSRAAAAGFDPETVSGLQMFADQFGAHRLNEACSKFISLCERRTDLIDPWKAGKHPAVRSSYGSDMSIDEDDPTIPELNSIGPHQLLHHNNKHTTVQQQQQLLDQPKPSTYHQPYSAAFPLRRNRVSSFDKDANSGSKEDKGAPADQADSTQTSQPARRLSVQDRINLFENKQKETSSSSNSGGGGKPVTVGKAAEIGRLSSDVSAEQSVLRRWSGASDMSIDLSAEKKEIDSPLCTPSSVPLSHTKSGDKSKGLIDTATSHKSEFRSVSGGVNDTELKVNSKKLTSTLAADGNGGLNNQSCGNTQSRSLFSRAAEDNRLKDQQTCQTQFRPVPVGRAEQFDFEDCCTVKKEELSGVQASSLNNWAGPQTQSGAFASNSGENIPSRESSQDLHAEFPNQVEGCTLKDQSLNQPGLKESLRTTVESGQLKAGSGSKIQGESAAQYKETEGDSSPPSQPRVRSLGEVEESGKKNLTTSQEEFGSPAIGEEDSGFQNMKLQKQFPGSKQIKKPQQGRRDESSSVKSGIRTLSSGKIVLDGREGFGSMLTQPAAQVQRVRQSKGNQELNDELKMKANELEKLFAEHKLRVPGDQSNSAKRSKPADVQNEVATNLPYMKPVADTSPAQFSAKSTSTGADGSLSNVAKYSVSSLMQKVDNEDKRYPLDQNFSDDSRGNFYDRYMQKRDAKLREESGVIRAEKEAKLKAMHDSLEKSRAELKAKFSGSADRQDSVSIARRRAERLRSFNTRAIRREQPLEFVQREDDEDLSGFPEQKPVDQDRSFTEMFMGDNASRSIQGKKLLPNKSSSSSIPCTSAAPLPRSVVKASNPSSGRRRAQSENPLVQSVPNFSDLRKENTKPYSAAGKIRPQLRNSSRSKSTSVEIPLFQEEKPHRSQSLRKSSGSPAEFQATSPMNSEPKQQSLHDIFSRNMESRKGNELDPRAEAGISKLKASMTSDAMDYGEESDELDLESVDVNKEEEDEFEAITTENHANWDSGQPRMSQEAEKLANSGMGNGDAMKTLSQEGHSVPSTFHPAGSGQDSQVESPVSWNLGIHHPFAYSHEASDIDASVDSPMGSPTSWNSHPLNQTDADAARMRKKWGSAQKPFIVANSSQNQSLKDVTRGFKRLLQFGRKSRGTESLVDWISASTSEGDDDTEDGRDPANRSSEDLRKSRMGFSRGHPSDDNLNEIEFLSEQVQALNSSIPAPPANFKMRDNHLSGSSIKAPRSFFSLSSFRSKGSDTKLR